MGAITMMRENVLKIIKAHQDDLFKMGVVHLAVFGSVARGDDHSESDVDVVIDVDPTKVTGIFAIGHIQESLKDWIGRSVDVARRDRLNSTITAEIKKDAINAF